MLFLLALWLFGIALRRVRRFRRRRIAPAGLRLAAAEIGAQGFGETIGPFLGFGFGGRTHLISNFMRVAACTGASLVALGRRAGRVSSGKFPGKRCSSSVVEHSLGKGEVESSILSCSTILSP